MSWSAELAAAKREMKTLLARGLGQIFLWTLTAKSSSLGDNDAVQSGDDGVDPGAPANEQKGQRKVIRVQSWGFNGAPPTNLRSLTLRLGSSNLFWIGIGPTQAYGPQDLDVGETAVYAISKALIRLWKAGKLSLNSDTGQGADVVVNGGTAKVGRVGDTVDAGSISTVIVVAAPTVTVTANWIPPGGGTPMQLFTFSATGTGTAGTTVVPLTGKISSGADHFKG